MPFADCPSDARLRAFDAGDVSDAELDGIAAHLGRCPECVARMGRVAVPLPPSLSGLSTDAVPEPGWSAYQRAVERAAEVAGRPRPPAVGDTLRDYHLVEQIGAGGMGVVFRAVHTKLDKVVAVKVLSGRRWHDPAAVLRFEREMRAIGRLSHPNIVQATDADDADGTPFLVMEYVAGENLSALVRRAGPRPPAEAVELVRQAADGLAHAHRAGVIHRDVKPSNLMLGPDGRVKVLDLGLALPLADPELADAPPGSTADGPAGPTHLTAAGITVGTLDYMAPEQRLDPHAVDARADVYGLGCTLWFLLTGAPPQPGDATAAPPGGLPAAVWRRFLASDPAERFADMAGVVAALDVATAPAPRRPRLIAVGLGVAVVLIAAAVVAFVALNRTPAQNPTPPVAEPSPEIGSLPMTGDQAADLQRRWAEHRGVPVLVEGANETALRLIPPGEFMLSSQCRVRITRPFRLAGTEVTVAQFRRFVEATGYVTSAVSTGQGGRRLVPDFHTGDKQVVSDQMLTWEKPGHRVLDPDQPVCTVSWDDAMAYCRWLGGHYRLPTEAEMVWATRCGDPSDEPIDPEGMCPLSLGWHKRNCDQPMPVGRLAANAWGLYDTHGNVAEWCGDRAGPLPVGTFDDYAGVTDVPHRSRVFVGYTYLAPVFKPRPLRSFTPSDRSFTHLGFRVACDVP